MEEIELEYKIGAELSKIDAFLSRQKIVMRDKNTGNKTYFDTAKHAVLALGYCLRVRPVSAQKQKKLKEKFGEVVTHKLVAKTMGILTKEGAFLRREVKSWLKSEQPNFKHIEEKDVREKFKAIPKEEFAEVFSTKTGRKTGLIQLGPEPHQCAKVDVIFGHLFVPGEAECVVLSRLEIESHGCTEQQLANFRAKALREIPGAKLLTYSDADLGYSIILNPLESRRLLGTRAVDLDSVIYAPVKPQPAAKPKFAREPADVAYQVA